MTRARRTRTPHRLFAGLTGVALLAAVALAPTAQTTEASWVDAEVGAAEFTAATGLATPEYTQACTASSGLLGVNPVLKLYWRVPETMVGYSIEAGNVEFVQVSSAGVLLPITNVLLGNQAHEGDASGYISTVNFGLLGGLLGGSGTIAVRFTGPDDWRSDWMVASGTFPTLGGNGTCKLSYSANP